MKRLFLSVAILVFGYTANSFAGRDYVIESDIGPAFSTNTVTLSAAGAGKRNCLTDLTFISNSTYTINVLVGQTTFFQLLMPANTGLVKDWDIQKPVCTANNEAMQIKIDNGAFKINYQGFVGR